MKRLQQNLDGGLVAQILMPRVGASVVNVAVCQNGRGQHVSVDANLGSFRYFFMFAIVDISLIAARFWIFGNCR